MEKTKSRAKAPANRSSHIIDLRKSGGSSAAKKKPSRVAAEPEESIEVQAVRAGRPQAAPLSPELETSSSGQAAPLDSKETKVDAPAAADPDDAESPEEEPIQPPARSDAAQPEPAAASKAPASPVRRAVVDDDIAPHHSFWPAFWRFIVLVAVFSALVVGGTYLYLHYHSF